MGTQDIGVRATLKVRGDRLTIDLTGSHDQVQSYVNSSKANTYSNVYLGVATMMDPEIPKNESFFEAITLVLPSHSVVNADEPAPVTACTLNIGGEIAEAVAYAFEGILPERVYPQTLKIGALIMGTPTSIAAPVGPVPCAAWTDGAGSPTTTACRRWPMPRS
jgi:N-methylhydantoinase B